MMKQNSSTMTTSTVVRSVVSPCWWPSGVSALALSTTGCGLFLSLGPGTPGYSACPLGATDARSSTVSTWPLEDCAGGVTDHV